MSRIKKYWEKSQNDLEINVCGGKDTWRNMLLDNYLKEKNVRRNMSGRYFLGRKLWVTLRDNYSKQRPDIENLFTHPWSVSIGKTAIFVFKLLSFYVEWSDQHKFYMKLKEKLSTLKPTSKTSISKTKMLWNLIFLCSTSSIFTT